MGRDRGRHLLRVPMAAITLRSDLEPVNVFQNDGELGASEVLEEPAHGARTGSPAPPKVRARLPRLVIFLLPRWVFRIFNRNLRVMKL